MSSEDLGQWAGDCSVLQPAPPATGLAITICTWTPHDTQLRYTHQHKHRVAGGLQQRNRKGKREPSLSIGPREGHPPNHQLLHYKTLFKNSIIKRINNKIY